MSDSSLLDVWSVEEATEEQLDTFQKWLVDVAATDVPGAPLTIPLGKGFAPPVVVDTNLARLVLAAVNLAKRVSEDESRVVLAHGLLISLASGVPLGVDTSRVHNVGAGIN